MKKANRGNFGTCAKCRQQILWIKTINGKNMPVNARLITYRVPKEGKGKERIVKEAFNEKVIALGEAVKGKDDAKMADAFRALEPELEKLVAQWKELLPKAEIIPISALSNFNIDYVKRRVEELMPDSPPYFEKDALTDKPARFFVTEIIREKILLYYQKEIPYAVEVVVELFKEDDELIHIKALIIVGRDTQKGIIIGHQGQALKKVGAMARKDIERFFGKKVFLEMFVKVEKDWRNRDNILKNFGYQLD